MNACDWQRKGFYAALEAETLSLLIYGPLGEGTGEHAIVAANVVQQIQDFRGNAIDIYINSPGGIVYEGLAIYNALRRHPAHKIVRIDGICASAATIVAMAGDRIVAADNATLMVHAVWHTVSGDAAEMRKEAEVLDQLTDTLVNLYVQRTGRPRAEVAGWVAEETWFTAAEALRLGLVDEIAVASRAVASWDCAAFGIKPPDSGLGARDSGSGIAELRREVSELRREVGLLRAMRGDPQAVAVLEALGEAFGEWIGHLKDGIVEALEEDVRLQDAAALFRADLEGGGGPDGGATAAEIDAGSAAEPSIESLLARVAGGPGA
jgi:ATP-dependent Clp protease protease subunit